MVIKNYNFLIILVKVTIDDSVQPGAENHAVESEMCQVGVEPEVDKKKGSLQGIIFRTPRKSYQPWIGEIGPLIAPFSKRNFCTNMMQGKTIKGMRMNKKTSITQEIAFMVLSCACRLLL